MSFSKFPSSGRQFLLVFLAVALVATMLVWSTAPKAAPASPRAEAVPLTNYDIRLDKNAVETLASYRTRAGRGPYDGVSLSDRMTAGEKELRRRVPALKVERNIDLRVPEVIAPDVTKGRTFLTRPSGARRSDILKDFLAENSELIGARGQEIAELKVFADYTNPDGGLSFVELNQEIAGIPVFRGEVKAGFTRSGEIVRVINNLVPGLDGAEISQDFGDPATAVRSAAAHVKDPALSAADLVPNAKLSTELKIAFGSGAAAPKAEKMYFPTEFGVVVPAWRVLIWQRVNAYYVIVDANTGTMLWRKNLTEDQHQPATYSVFANPNAMINIADSPFPMTPGPASPNGIQASGIPRSRITRIGNEAPYTFNNLGWITDGNNSLDGNNVQAGLDREEPNVGALDPNAIDPGSVPIGSPNRIFDFPFNPGIPTNPAINTGDSPLPEGQSPQVCLEEGTAATPTDFQKASTTQLFYITNVFHDEMYRLGFTEAARNFQDDNFGRGGLGGDRISAQAQDCSGINNANFATPADGERGQMQMYLWQGPNPDFDGSLDAHIVVHELTHGVSSRLHGNGTGLFLDIARGMGEGWSDFYAQCLLSEPGDPLDGIYPLVAYNTYLFSSVGFNNYYYGIRRFPLAIMSSVGGSQGRPHNPLTFQDIDSDRSEISDGAFSPRFFPTADAVHAIGEVWASALWEIRARMIQRLGWEAGNRRILQFVTDGMKLAPIGPTPISERDALIAAIYASGTEEDLADAWAGFAIRGMGTGASIQALGGISTGGTGTVRVTESFELPNIDQSPVISVSDATGDGDGYPEPGEMVSITIPLTNSTGRTATGVSAAIAGGGTADYGTLTGRSEASRTMTYKLPGCSGCGSVTTISISVNSSLGPVSFTRQIFVGRPGSTAAAENFDSVTAPQLPAGWTAVPTAGGINFVNIASSADSAPNTMYARNPTAVGGGTDLTAPPISVIAPDATVSFRHSFNTERGWDGGVLEISIAGGDFQDLIAAGGTFTQNGYNDVISGGRNNPIASRAGWTGNSNGYITTTAQMPDSAAGKVVRLRWRFGADDNTAGTGADPGWRVDTITLAGAGFISEFVCSINIPTVSISGRVLSPQGIPVRGASVTLTDACSGTTRVTTSSFGVYAFSGLPAGPNYVVGVASKRYRFSPRILDLASPITDLDLIGLE